MSTSPGSALFINRELSWLEFNARVLHEALDARTPLLERLKFLSIFASNLDEFYMVRVAGLRRQVAAGVTHLPPDGLTPQEQLDAIESRVRQLRDQAEACYFELLDALATHGVRLVGMSELSPGEWSRIDSFFESQIFPVLTPLAVDPGHPFPYISNLSLSLAVEVRDPDTGAIRFARVKVPKNLPRWIPIDRPLHFIPVETVIAANLGTLFPGMEIAGCYGFRFTRYSDIDLTGTEEPEDLLATIEEQVFQRRFGEVVRLEVQHDMPEHLRTILLDELREEEATTPVHPLTAADVQECRVPLDLGDLIALSGLDLAELRDPPFTPGTPPELRDPNRSIFEAIRDQDILVHHPFESFPATVERFLESAAADPDVLAIKMTLYRTSGDTATVRALTAAAQAGKQVAVLVELKARFDEANNITWARTLESYGVHVAYGVPLIKTHAKTTMVVRREGDAFRRYVHIGTGNYNSKTSRIYSDLGFFTCSASIGADVGDLFNSLTGFSRQRLWRKLIVAPINMRDRFIQLIDREAEHAVAGRGGRVIGKMNSLVDAEIIHALYRAAEAGVEIDLVVRGICCLRPGLEGVSENIRVRSIVGRFLEHARVWYFGNGGAPEYYLGSADWMTRNFDRRVEAVVPIEHPALHARLESLLAIQLADNRQAWELAADGRWRQRMPGTEPERATHRILLRDPWGRVWENAPAATAGPDASDEQQQELSAR